MQDERKYAGHGTTIRENAGQTCRKQDSWQLCGCKHSLLLNQRPGQWKIYLFFLLIRPTHHQRVCANWTNFLWFFVKEMRCEHFLNYCSGFGSTTRKLLSNFSIWIDYCKLLFAWLLTRKTTLCFATIASSCGFLNETPVSWWWRCPCHFLMVLCSNMLHNIITTSM